jgi:hypothetical protein
LLQHRHTRVEVEELAKIYWPVAFLHAEVEMAFAIPDPTLTDEMIQISDAIEAESQDYCETLYAWSNHDCTPPGDLIGKARALAAFLLKQHNNDWRYLRNTDPLLSELVRCMCTIKTPDDIYKLTEAWKSLGSYVNEDDRTLQSLERMSKDAQWSSQSFPSC